MAINYDLNNTGPEVQERLDQVMPNKTDISQEVLDRQEADNALQEQITAINNEIGESGQGGETINGRLDTLEAAVGDGGSVDERIAASAAELVGTATEDYDTLGKVEGVIEQNKADQQTVNDDTYRKNETYSKEQLDNLITTPDQQWAVAEATEETTDVTDVLPATGAADTIYRVGFWNGTQYDDHPTGQYDDTAYSMYAWDGTSYVLLAVRTLDADTAVFNVTEYNAGTTYANATAAANAVPAGYRKPGLLITFQETTTGDWLNYQFTSDDPTNDWLTASAWQAPLTYQLGVFDISAYHATGGTLATYNDLAAALGTNGANIPPAYRKGGMSIKFVLTSDNKYVEYLCNSQTFTTDITAWKKNNLEKEVDYANNGITQTFKRLSLGNAFASGYYGIISNGGFWANISEAFQYRLYPIYENDVVVIKALAEGGGNYALLNDIPVPKQNEPADFFTGTSRTQISYNTPVTINPSKNGYLYVSHLYSNNPFPVQVIINGIDASITWNDVLSNLDLLNKEREKSKLSQVDSLICDRLSLGNAFVSGYYGTISSDGIWTNISEGFQYRLYAIHTGDKIRLEAINEGGGNYALLNTIPIPKEGDEADFFDGTGRTQISYWSPVDITINSDGYLYVSHLYNGASFSVRVLINNIDVTQNFDNILRDLRELNAVKTAGDFENSGIELAGTENSRIVFDKPIVLSNNGDSIELDVSTSELGESAYSFSNSGLSSNNYYAVALSSNYVGIRSSSGTWLYRNAITTNGRIRLKIEYADNKIILTINNSVLTTLDSLSDVQIASIGNGGTGNYGYWKGIVYEVKVNGVTLNMFRYANLLNVRLSEPINLPKGILSYNSASKLFTFFTRKEGTNYYWSYVITNVVDLSELEYLNEWRLNGGSLYKYENGLFSKVCDTIYSPENEFTIKFEGKSDYTGGYHGDERIDIDSSSFVKFFADGKLLDLTDDFEINCSTFNYIQSSTLHETTSDGSTPVTGHPIVAYHLKNTEIHGGHIVVKNSVKFASQQTVTECIGGLFCIHKNAANYAEYPFAKVTPQLSGNSDYYNSDNPDNSEINFWNNINNIKVLVEGEFKQGENNSELTRLQIWDRSNDTKYYRRTGNSYNKIFNSGDILRNEQHVYFQ